MNARAILDATYQDTAAVFRRENYVDSATGQTCQRDIPVAAGVRCGLSKNGAQSYRSDGNSGTASGSFLLFANPDAPICPGDKIEVKTASGMTVIARAGKPFLYPSHMELSLHKENRT